MGVIDKVRNAFGGSESDEESDQRTEVGEPPSHLCQSCGEEYFSNPDIAIDTCRACGGTKVEVVE